MKRALFVVAIVAAFIQLSFESLRAAPVKPMPGNNGQHKGAVVHNVIARDSNSSVHELIRESTNASGRTVYQTNRYTTLATGMNLRGADGTYTAASAEIEADANGGAIVKKARHKIHFSPDITDPKGPVQFSHGGKVFHSKPLCISYWDAATGKSVLISEFRSTAATLAPGDSKIVWKDCSTDFKCNLIIDNQLAGMDQCLEILECPPAPSEFGLNNASTRLEMITEFFDPPASTKHSIKNKDVNDDGFIRFGELVIPPGKAFKIGDSKSSTYVTKQWTKLDGRDCLIEQIPYSAVERYLTGLPLHAGIKAAAGKKRLAAMVRELPKPLAQSAPLAEKILIAKNADLEPGLILDYSIVNADSINTNSFTFLSGQTYLITNAAWFPSVTIEGGSVIKYTDNGALWIANASNLVVKSSPYNPVIFTAWNDDSVGETVSGSDGSPVVGNAIALRISGGYPWPAEHSDLGMILRGINFRYMATAVEGWIGNYTFDDVQAVNCDTLVHVIVGTVRMRNGLIHNSSEPFNVEVTINSYPSGLYLQNVTVHNAGHLCDWVDTCGADPSSWSDANFDFKANNCLFVNIATNNEYTGSCSFPTLDSSIIGTSAVLTDDTDVFETVEAGAHYLPTNSIYRGAGDTNVDVSLLASLHKKTTVSPEVITNDISEDTTLEARPIRDVSGLDLGYHYDPIDYVIGGKSIDASLLLTNGVVLAADYSSSQAMVLDCGGSILSEGTASAPNRIISYNSVQEANVGAPPSDAVLVCFFGCGDSRMLCRFTDFEVPVIVGYFYSQFSAGIFSFRDCELRGGSGWYFDNRYSSDPLDLSLTNCLFDGSGFGVNVWYDAPTVNFIAYNNLFYNSGVSSWQGSSAPSSTYTLKDNQFFQSSVALSSYGATVDADYNAYVSATTSNSGPHDIILTNFNFQSGPLGNYYQPTNSPLLHTGSRSATVAGLDSYTVLTNQVVDGTNQVSIGLHYTTNAIPPAILTQSSSQTVNEGSAATFSVTATGSTVLTYQWRKNGSNISGATASAYVLSSAQPTDEADYTVVVANVAGSVTSSAATLSVVVPPAISTQPASQTVNQGQTAMFSVVASGTSPLSYQWQFNGANISGATATSLSLSNAQTANAGSYRVIVTNFAGTVTSSAATLTVNIPPTITNQPVSTKALCPGGSATLSVGATGTSLLYQWIRNGSSISGATQTSIVVTYVDAGTYSVVVSNSCGSTISSNSIVQANVPVSITSQPASQTVCSNDTAVFTVGANGTALTYQWKRNGTNFSGSNVSGTNSASLTIYPVSSIDQASYSIVVSGTCGSLTSTNALLSIYNPSVGPTNQTACPGNSVTFASTAFGPGPFHYEWSKVGGTLGTNAFGTNTSSLTLNPVKTDDAGTYMVHLMGVCGTASISTNSNAKLRLISGTNTITVNDGDSNDQSSELGVVTYIGSAGPGWGIDVSVGATTPTVGSPDEPVIDLETFSQSSAAADLIIQYTETDFTANNATFAADLGGTSDGNVTFRYYADTNNTAFGTNVLLATFSGGVAYDMATNGVINISKPYSITLEARIHHNGVGTTGFDQYLSITNQFPDSGANDYKFAELTICTNTLSVSLTNPTSSALFVISPTNIPLVAVVSNVASVTNVEFYMNSINIGVAEHVTNNIYSLNHRPAFGGTNVYSVKVWDNNGNTATDQVSVVVNFLPTVSVATPTNGAQLFTPGTNILLTASAADLDGSVTNVQFFVGTNKIGSAGASPWTVTWSNVQHGTYSILARATDNRGASGNSPLTTLTVHNTNTPPLVYAGPNQTLDLSTNPVQLAGVVVDDGLPSNSLSTTWTKVSGPGNVFLGNSNAAQSTVTFTNAGTYVLQLFATDTQFSASNSVTLVVQDCYRTPSVNAGTAQTLVLPALQPTNALQTVKILQLTNFTNCAGGVGYFAPANSLLISVDDTPPFKLVSPNGTVTSFSAFTNLGEDEVYVATVRDDLGGFERGTVFSGNGITSEILRFRPDGTTVGTLGESGHAWVVLTNVAEYGITALWVDTTGTWNGDLIVATLDDQAIWRINSSGQVKLVTAFGFSDGFGGHPPALEGLTTIPNDVKRYGPWAGRIVVGGDYPGTLYAIDTNGVAVQYNFTFGAEDIRIIPENENLYLANDFADHLFGISASEFKGMAGDILIADEMSSMLYRVFWNGTTFDARCIGQIANENLWAQMSFCPVETGVVHSANGLQLHGIVSNVCATTGVSWLKESGPGTVTFDDSHQTNTIVRFSEAGQYYLRLSATNGDLSAYDRLRIDVLRNLAPTNNAGSDQVITSTNTTLVGEVWDDGLPNHQTNLVWTQIQGPGTAWFANPTAASTLVSFNVPGTYVLRFTINDGQATNSSQVRVTVQAPSLKLSSSGWPARTNTSQTFTATLLNTNGLPLTNATVVFYVNGVTSTNGGSTGTTATTDTNGHAAFTYSGVFPGRDWVYAQYGGGAVTISSPTVTQDWAVSGDCSLAESETDWAGSISLEAPANQTNAARYYVISMTNGEAMMFDVYADKYVYNPISGPVGVFANIGMFLHDPSHNIVIYGQTNELMYVPPFSGDYLLEIVNLDPETTLADYNINTRCGSAIPDYPTLQLLFNGTNVPNGSTITFPLTTPTQPTNTFLVVTNADKSSSGNNALIVSGIATNGPFNITNNIIGTSIGKGTSTTLGISFSPPTNGTFVGAMVLTNNGTTENYVVYLVGQAFASGNYPAVQLLSPSNNSSFSAAANVSLVAAATNGVTNISHVDFVWVATNGNFLVGSVTNNSSDAGHLYNFIWPKVPEGDYTVQAVAVDAGGRSTATPPATIHVKASDGNRLPVAVNDYTTVLANSTYNVFTPLNNDSDPDGDDLKIVSVGQPYLGSPQIINSGKSISYIPTSGYSGTDYFTYTVSDGRGGTATAKIYVTISAAAAPKVQFTSPAPDTVVSSGVPVILSTQVTPADFVGKVEYFIENLKIGEVTNAPYNFAWTPVDHGNQPEIVARATDIYKQFSEAALSLTVTNPAGVSTPVAAIDNLTNSVTTVNNHVFTNIATIRNGFFDLQGRALLTNTVSTNVSYTVHVVSTIDGSLVKDVTPLPRNADGFHLGYALTSSSLGTLDFTTLQNGIYDLELVVRGDYQDAVDTKRFALESDLKIGQFSFTEQDLVIPVNGFPITVMRTYNSLNPNVGDFGYSWTYSINDVQMQLDEERTQTEALFQDDADESSPSGKYFSLRTGGGRNVTLTLPDGRRTTFLYYLQATTCNSGDDADLCAQPTWQSAPGILYGLKPLTNVKLATLPHGLEWWDDDSSTGVENYDFSGFVLTNRDGTQYVITRDKLGEQYFLSGGIDGNYAHPYGAAHLTQIIQRSGDKINISPESIVHVDSLGNTTRSIKIVRDAQNRIRAIYDPNGLDSSGNPSGPAAVVYDYAGDNLVRVLHLQDRANSLYTTNTYEYTNSAFPHYVTGIVDPRGLQVAKNYYDDSGRLTAVEDANGKRTQFIHNTSSNVEIVTDRLGNTNSYVYDLRGNVIATTNALHQVAVSTYNDINQVIAETNAIGTAFATWKTNGYDATGNLTVTVDALHTNAFTYDAWNNLATQTDSLGNVTSNKYDPSGNLTDTYQLDSSGHVVSHSSSVYTNGKLSETDDANGHATATFGFTGDNLTSTTDANGLTRNFVYDDNGNQTDSSFVWVAPDSSHHTVATHSDYDGSGRVSHTVDSDANETFTTYNSLGKVAVSIDKLGNTNTFFYDSRGNLVQTVYPDGLYTTTAYDDNGRAYFTLDLNGSTATRTDYDALGRVTNSVRFTGASISVTQNAYIADVWESSVTSYGTPISTNSTEYYPNGLVKSRTDAAGQTTSYDYWPDGHVRYVTNALHQVTYFEYDAACHQKLVRDARLHDTHFDYDAIGRLTKTTFHDSTFTSNIFNNVGQRVGQVDQANVLKSFTYDLSGQLTAVTNAPVPDPESSYAMVSPTWQYHYDQYGRLTVMTDAKGRNTTNVFDAVGRQISRLLPMGQTNWTEYDSKGQLWKQHDFKGQTTELVYDRFGRTKAKFYFAAGDSSPSNAVCYQYNNLGQLWRITERSGADATTNACDGYSVLVPTHFKKGPQKWYYAALAKIPVNVQGGCLVIPALALALILIPRGDKRRFIIAVRAAFAQFNLPEETHRKLRPPSLVLRSLSLVMIVVLLCTDDKLGMVWNLHAQCSIPSNSSTETTRITEFTYDADGHLTQVNSPEGVINYGYDLATGRHTDTCTKNSEIGYGYDELGRLKTVTVYKRNGTALTTPEQITYTYDEVGNRESVTLPNGIVSTWQYDSLNRLTNLTHQAGTTNLATYVYQLHETGRRTNATEIIRLPDGNSATYRTNALTWAYDAMYRLTNEVVTSTASSGQYNDVYAYDRVGNRLEKIHSAGANTTTTSYTYNANDELLQEIASLNSSLTTNLYSYDANGSLTNKTGGTGGTNYVYNLNNKLSAVTIGSVTTSYLYNDQGIRVRSSSGSSDTHYLTDANNPTGYAQTIEELSSPGATPTRSYIIGDDMLGQAGSTTASYFLPDGHGSTRQLAASPSSISSQYNYDSYGNSLVDLGSSPDTTHLYCREQFDATLQMYNLRARFFQPTVGRFTQRDTVEGSIFDPENLHKYTYCNSDPGNSTDPTGNLSLGEVLSTEFIYLLGFAILAGALTAVFQNASLRTEVAQAGHLLLTQAGDAISESAAALTTVISTMLAQMNQTLRAIRDAINQATKVVKETFNELMKLPKYPVFRSFTPSIFHFDSLALSMRPDWFILRYNGSKSAQTIANRRWLRSSYAGFWPAPPGYQVDEFPYASTNLGGQWGPAMVTYVPTSPIHENSRQGWTLSLFYRGSLRLAPKKFLVVPIPL